MLVLSYNRLEELTFVQPLPKLLALDCSHNLLNRIGGLQHARGLGKLNVSHNKLQRIPSSFVVLHVLEELDLSQNGLSQYVLRFSI